MTTQPTRARCLDCKRVVGAYVRRGLCPTCYRAPDVREEYQRRSEYDERARRGWDILADTELIELFESGLSDLEIAAQMGRKRGSVCKRRAKLGLVVGRARHVAHQSAAATRRRARERAR
jgi:hypothetical protein